LRATFKQYNEIMLYGTSDTLKLDDLFGIKGEIGC
jgi:hypothetical protein